MKESFYLLLQGFIEKYSKDKEKRLTSLLPSSEREKLKKPQKELSLEDFSSDILFSRVHYSWFLPTLNSYSRKEQSFFISSIEGNVQKDLQAVFNVPYLELTENNKSFFKEHLLSSILDDYLPLDYLPPSPLTDFLQIPKIEMVEIIDHLALFDLALDLTKIVNTKVLKKIHSFLNEKEKKILKSILPYKEPFSLPPTVLIKMDSEASFRKSLHQRGLNRFAKGICNQDKHFIWHLCHHLDIGRGNIILKLTEKKISPNVSNVIIKNILKLMQMRTS